MNIDEAIAHAEEVASRKFDDLGAEYVMGTRDGWNACLEKITGE